jgi:hypothetical protein
LVFKPASEFHSPRENCSIAKSLAPRSATSVPPLLTNSFNAAMPSLPTPARHSGGKFTPSPPPPPRPQAAAGAPAPVIIAVLSSGITMTSYFSIMIPGFNVFIHQTRVWELEILHQPAGPSFVDVPTGIALPKPDPQLLRNTSPVALVFKTYMSSSGSLTVRFITFFSM